MGVDSVRKALYLVAVTALIVVFYGYASAFELGNNPQELSGLLLAQQFRGSADDRLATPRFELLAQAEKDEVDKKDEDADDDDEYDDDEYDDDEYADDDVKLINDPMIGGNKQLYAFNDNMYFLVLKPVAQV